MRGWWWRLVVVPGVLVLGLMVGPAWASGAPAATPDPSGPTKVTPDDGTCWIGDREPVTGAASDVIVSLDPDTLWRPRETQVNFTFSSATGTSAPDVRGVRVCFRWTDGAGKARNGPKHLYFASPLVGSVPTGTGAVEYGAVVPDLPRVQVGAADRLGGGDVSFTGFYTVPVAWMQVVAEIGTGDDRRFVRVVLPVGVTEVPVALLVLMVTVLGAISIIWSCAPAALLALPYFPGQLVAGNAAAIAAATAQGLPVPAQVPRRGARLMRRALAVIATDTGNASLSQFQILLWSFVVGGAAVYVMTLSGNLVALSTGTLTLLGIAGGASLLSRVPAGGQQQLPPGGPAPIVVAPQWCQMLYGETPGQIDVTRVQMLLFTLVIAAFVTIKVAVTYSIPQIPDNFLLLMGISNGVYIAGKHIPSSS